MDSDTSFVDADASQGRQRCFGCPYAAPAESLRQGLCEVCYKRRGEGKLLHYDMVDSDAGAGAEGFF